MLAVQQGADRAAAVLLGDRGADPHKVVARAREHGGDTGGHFAEVVDHAEIVVQWRAFMHERWRHDAADVDTLVGGELQAIAEALFEQPAQALGVLAQGAVEGRQLIGQQPCFAGQMLLPGVEVGCAQRAKREDGAAGDDHGKNERKRQAELRGDSSTRLLQGIS